MLRGWLDEGETPNPISVNVSRVNLFNPNIVRIICDLVDSYEVPRELLQLELTESAYADATLAMKDKVQTLRDEGFQVLMDDFGSGYSSLNVLKDIEVDVLMNISPMGHTQLMDYKPFGILESTKNAVSGIWPPIRA